MNNLIIERPGVTGKKPLKVLMKYYYRPVKSDYLSVRSSLVIFY